MTTWTRAPRPTCLPWIRAAFNLFLGFPVTQSKYTLTSLPSPCIRGLARNIPVQHCSLSFSKSALEVPIREEGTCVAVKALGFIPGSDCQGVPPLVAAAKTA